MYTYFIINKFFQINILSPQAPKEASFLFKHAHFMSYDLYISQECHFSSPEVPQLIGW